MLFSTIGQYRLFLWMLADGAAIAAWYACTAAIRHLLCAGPLISLLLDLIFGAGAAALFCGALLIGDYGRFHLYAVLAAGLGAALFAVGVFPPAKRAAFTCIRAFYRIVVTIREYRWIKVIFK